MGDHTYFENTADHVMPTSLGESTFIIIKYLFLKVVPFPQIRRISAEEQSSHTLRFMVSVSSLFILKLIFSST